MASFQNKNENAFYKLYLTASKFSIFLFGFVLNKVTKKFFKTNNLDNTIGKKNSTKNNKT
jgi:hypothetical protein